MNEPTITRTPGAPSALSVQGSTLRDVAMPLFRHRCLVSVIFAGTICGAVGGALLLPAKYEAHTKILVTRDRFEAAITAEPKDFEGAAPAPLVSEEDINSEVELLKSRDLLEQVVESCGLASGEPGLWAHTVDRTVDRARAILHIAPPTEQMRVDGAVRRLGDTLVTEPIKKANLIRVTYQSANPILAARVLEVLDSLYQREHAAVYRPQGTFVFFDQQASLYETQLAAAEERLRAFDQQNGLVTSPLQKQMVLQELSQFESQWRSDQAASNAAAARAISLEAQTRAMPDRQTTQVRAAGNAPLLADLNSTLLNLQLKQSDLNSKFMAGYPPLRALDTQISEAQGAVAAAEKNPIQDVTTDRVPARDWMTTELAKTKADQAEFAARASGEARLVREYTAVAQRIDEDDARQDDLVRDVKTAEDNYLLHLRKREEARISDALDSKRIVSVSIAEAPSVPSTSTLNLAWVLAGSIFVGGALACGAAYGMDRVDTALHTPREIARYLNLQTLASIPEGYSLS
jgi:uncharacterized protein involved in exopolysaccharide biosynthesis